MLGSESSTIRAARCTHRRNAFATRSGDSGAEASKCRVIKDMCGRVADFLHRQPHAARILLKTLVAAHVGGLADAWHQRQRPVERPDHLTDRDVSRPPAEDISAGATFLALDETVVLQLQENGFEELLRKSLPLSEFRRLNGTASGLIRQDEQRFQPVFRLLGEHPEKSTKPVG